MKRVVYMPQVHSMLLEDEAPIIIVSGITTVVLDTMYAQSEFFVWNNFDKINKSYNKGGILKLRGNILETNSTTNNIKKSSCKHRSANGHYGSCNPIKDCSQRWFLYRSSCGPKKPILKFAAVRAQQLFPREPEAIKCFYFSGITWKRQFLTKPDNRNEIIN
ncbi:hypothetical protein ABEB36_014879 [Hypothenemus hampei]|uniref:Uncharacterized protein n=1 Tax=Hypothenemus hampei TaxID=57062 RepID=A0ABD1E1E8_HYPHA